jgi:hypothetical protein
VVPGRTKGNTTLDEAGTTLSESNSETTSKYVSTATAGEGSNGSSSSQDALPPSELPHAGKPAWSSASSNMTVAKAATSKKNRWQLDFGAATNHHGTDAKIEQAGQHFVLHTTNRPKKS